MKGRVHDLTGLQTEAGLRPAFPKNVARSLTYLQLLLQPVDTEASSLCEGPFEEHLLRWNFLIEVEGLRTECVTLRGTGEI